MGVFVPVEFSQKKTGRCREVTHLEGTAGPGLSNWLFVRSEFLWQRSGQNVAPCWFFINEEKIVLQANFRKNSLKISGVELKCREIIVCTVCDVLYVLHLDYNVVLSLSNTLQLLSRFTPFREKQG